jgi:S-adenosylmethionine synthetase
LHLGSACSSELQAGGAGFDPAAWRVRRPDQRTIPRLKRRPYRFCALGRGLSCGGIERLQNEPPPIITNLPPLPRSHASYAGADASKHVFTSESASGGHPDKVCDYVADFLLDAHLAQDPHARVACEVLVKHDHLILAGEITSRAHVDDDAVARQAVREIGYTDPAEPFHADGLTLPSLLGERAPEIARGVSASEQGAGDQGIMFGYATDETPELMPLPILLAHRLSAGLAAERKSGRISWLRPDAKTQVSVRYDEHGEPEVVTDVLISTQHGEGIAQEEIRAFVEEVLLPEVLGEWHHPGIRLLVNPTGTFLQDGPSADAGVTGRKIIVDTYGGMGRYGGGAFSGEDPFKVDRSGAYFCRYVARQIVREGIARRAGILETITAG